MLAFSSFQARSPGEDRRVSVLGVEGFWKLEEVAARWSQELAASPGSLPVAGAEAAAAVCGSRGGPV